MAAVRFGLYLIPPEGDLYRTGSAVTGYDIRARKELPSPDFLRPEWQSESGVYGFHATITDAIYIDEEELPAVSTRVREILSCFKSSNRYVLQKESVGFWGEGRSDAAVMLKPNRAVEMLHDVLVTAIHPLGQGTGYTDAYQKSPESFAANTPSQINKIKQFYGLYVFDEFVPHFTCINPFSGSEDERRRVEAGLRESFAQFESIEFDTLALVVQPPDEAHFRIVEEFDLHVQQ